MEAGSRARARGLGAPRLDRRPAFGLITSRWADSLMRCASMFSPNIPMAGRTVVTHFNKAHKGRLPGAGRDQAEPDDAAGSQRSPAGRGCGVERSGNELVVVVPA